MAADDNAICRQVCRVDQNGSGRHVFCDHMEFIGKDAWDHLPAWTAASTDRGLVVTTDVPKGVDRGAALGLCNRQGRCGSKRHCRPPNGLA